jgi:hypothetical protein
LTVLWNVKHLPDARTLLDRFLQRDLVRDLLCFRPTSPYSITSPRRRRPCVGHFLWLQSRVDDRVIADVAPLGCFA